MPAEANIEVARNGSFYRRFVFRDKETGAPLDITGWSFALQVKPNAGSPDVPLAAANFSDVDGPNGGVNVRLNGSQLASVEGAQEIVRLAYDLIARDESDVIAVHVWGQVILMPGVSSI